jgi:trans-aconitate methyltransferase
VASRLSPRLAALVDALPLHPGMRVLEVGCGPGAAARAVADRLTTGQVLAVDRSAAAVAQAVRATADRPDDGRLRFRHVAAEHLALEPGEQPYDLVFAFRVGALDGRHPALGARVLERLATVTTPDARLHVDGGDPLREVALPR